MFRVSAVVRAHEVQNEANLGSEDAAILELNRGRGWEGSGELEQTKNKRHPLPSFGK